VSGSSRRSRPPNVSQFAIRGQTRGQRHFGKTQIAGTCAGVGISGK